MTDDGQLSVRDITDEELAFYEEHGWVKLDGLISRESAARLLSAGEDLMARATAHPVDAVPALEGVSRSVTTDDWQASWGDFGFQIRTIRSGPFYDFSRSQAVGRLAQRVFNRERLTGGTCGVRFFEDALVFRAPMAPGDPSNATGYHQDGLFGSDRVGGFNLWIALDEVAPEQGAMRFLDGSHRAGPLGGEADFLAHYSRLPELYPFAPPLHYQPGDATIHHGLMVHGAPENVGDRPRWSYTPTYVPDDGAMRSREDARSTSDPRGRYAVIYP